MITIALRSVISIASCALDRVEVEHGNRQNTQANTRSPFSSEIPSIYIQPSANTTPS